MQCEVLCETFPVNIHSTHVHVRVHVRVCWEDILAIHHHTHLQPHLPTATPTCSPCRYDLRLPPRTNSMMTKGIRPPSWVRKWGAGRGQGVGVVMVGGSIGTLPPTITDAKKLHDVLVVKGVHGGNLPLQVIHNCVHLFTVNIGHFDGNLCMAKDRPYGCM